MENGFKKLFSFRNFLVVLGGISALLGVMKFIFDVDPSEVISRDIRMIIFGVLICYLSLVIIKALYENPIIIKIEYGGKNKRKK